MIQNNQQPNGTSYYPYSGYQYNPTVIPQYQRMMSMEQAPTLYQASPMGSFLKGRPVASLEEARAAQIDFDGSLHVFTDIGNKKIYTKQINLDGTATLNTYTLVQDKEDEAAEPPVEYVTKVEFNQALSQIQSMLISKKEEEKKSATLSF